MQEGRVDAPLFEREDQFVCLAFLHFDPGKRIGLAKRAQDLRCQMVHRRRTGEAHDETPALAFVEASDVLDHFVGFSQEAQRGLQEDLAAGIQRDALGGAIEQPDSELRLQRPHLLSERRLLNAEPGSRLREAALLGHRREIAQVSQFHGRGLAILARCARAPSRM